MSPESLVLQPKVTEVRWTGCGPNAQSRNQLLQTDRAISVGLAPAAALHPPGSLLMNLSACRIGRLRGKHSEMV